MNTFFFTVFAALLVMLFVVFCLGIGWICTGKMRLRRGTCGAPRDKRKKEDCTLCGTKADCSDEKCDENDHEAKKTLDHE